METNTFKMLRSLKMKKKKKKERNIHMTMKWSRSMRNKSKVNKSGCLLIRKFKKRVNITNLRY
jgi:hypothetical protein